MTVGEGIYSTVNSYTGRLHEGADVSYRITSQQKRCLFYGCVRYEPQIVLIFYGNGVRYKFGKIFLAGSVRGSSVLA